MNHASYQRYSRTAVRSFNRCSSGRNHSPRGTLAAQMRLRRRDSDDRCEGPIWLYPKLRVHTSRGDWQAVIQARREQRWWRARSHSPLQHLEQDAPKVQQSERHKISFVGRQGHPSLSGMGRLSSLQRLGDQQRLCTASNDRSNRQRQGLFAGQLPVGHLFRATTQSAADEGLNSRAYGWIANRIGQ